MTNLECNICRGRDISYEIYDPDPPRNLDFGIKFDVISKESITLFLGTIAEKLGDHLFINN